MILCLLFSKGYGHLLHVTHMGPVHEAITSNILPDKSPNFKADHQQETVLESSLFSDDYEDNPSSPEKKKESCVSYNPPLVSTHAEGFLLHVFKNSRWPERHFYPVTSNRYILLRVIRV